MSYFTVESHTLLAEKSAVRFAAYEINRLIRKSHVLLDAESLSKWAYKKHRIDKAPSLSAATKLVFFTSSRPHMRLEWASLKLIDVDASFIYYQLLRIFIKSEVSNVKGGH